MSINILYKGIGKIALGYFFVYFNFNINSVNILPNFVGYLLILYAIRDLEQEKSELLLLRPFGVILMIWHTAAWILSWFPIDLDGLSQIADTLIGLINLYFHFQLLTNLASIARKYQAEEDEHDTRLLHCRTIQSVILTAVMIVLNMSDWLGEYAAWISGIMIVVYIIAGIVIIKALLDFRRGLTADAESK